MFKRKPEISVAKVKITDIDFLKPKKGDKEETKQLLADGGVEIQPGIISKKVQRKMHQATDKTINN